MSRRANEEPAITAEGTQQHEGSKGATIGATGADRPRSRASGTAAVDPRPVIAVIGLAGFALLTWLVATRTILPFDAPLFDAARGLGQFLPEWRGLSDSANLPLIVVGVGIVLWLLWTRQRAEALLVIVILGLVTAGSELVKQLVARPRPPGVDNAYLGVVYSYPSGHTLEATTIYGIIAVLVWRSPLPRVVRLAVVILAVAIVALVAIARVAVGEHFPSDVLAGLLAGIAFVALFSWLTDILGRRRAADHR